jgi:hypothetical protein
MTETPRKPIFGFVFTPRQIQPGSPQVRWIRVPARGPLRLAVLVLVTLFSMSLLGSALFALAGMRSPAGVGIAMAVIVLSLPIIGLVSRAWVLGTFVNDTGVKISRWWRTEHVPWPAIDSVDEQAGMGGHQVILVTTDGMIRTSIGSATLDTLLRTEAWSIAVDRMQTWWRESRTSPPSAA